MAARGDSRTGFVRDAPTPVTTTSGEEEERAFLFPLDLPLPPSSISESTASSVDSSSIMYRSSRKEDLWNKRVLRRR